MKRSIDALSQQVHRFSLELIRVLPVRYRRSIGHFVHRSPENDQRSDAGQAKTGPEFTTVRQLFGAMSAEGPSSAPSACQDAG
jgi:hypothetical protein